MSEKIETRRSSRLVILDSMGSLLLFKYHDEHQCPFWATVGGELLAGEGYEDAAARELEEETGARIPVGRLLKEREEIYAVARSVPARWLERYFLVRSEGCFEPVTQKWTDEELSTIKAWKWWSHEEMLDSGAVFLPGWLPNLLGELIEQD